MDSRLKRNSEEVFEYLGWGPVAKDLSWTVVVLVHDGIDLVGGNGLEICGGGQAATHAADGVFDAALLPGLVRIAEVGEQAELFCEAMMAGEFATIVEGDGGTQWLGQGFEEGDELLCDAIGGLVGDPLDDGVSGPALMDDEQGPVALAKQHEVSLPVSRGLPCGYLGWTLADGNTLFDQFAKAAARSREVAPAMFAARQEAIPGGGGLARPVIDETIDGLVADDRATLLARQPAGDLLGRLSHRKAFLDVGCKVRLACQLEAGIPSSSSRCQSVCPLTIVEPGPLLGRLGIAFELTADRRC